MTSLRMRTEPDLAANNRKNIYEKEQAVRRVKALASAGVGVGREAHPGAAGNALHTRMKRPNEPIDASLIVASPTEKPEPIPYRVNLNRHFEEYNSHLGDVL